MGFYGGCFSLKLMWRLNWARYLQSTRPSFTTCKLWQGKTTSSRLATVQIFEGRNFCCFRGQLIIRENFILQISFLNLVCANRRAARIHVIWLYSSEGSLGGGWRLVGANHGFHFILHGYYSGFWYIREQFRCNKLQTSLGVVGNILSEILSHVAGCNHVVNQIRVISAKFDWQVILENKIAKILNLWHPRNLRASKICTYTV